MDCRDYLQLNKMKGCY